MEGMVHPCLSQVTGLGYTLSFHTGCAVINFVALERSKERRCKKLECKKQQNKQIFRGLNA